MNITLCKFYKKNLVRLLSLAFALILSFTLYREVLASEIFSDDFSDNLDKWIYVSGSGTLLENSWKVNSGVLVGEVFRGNYSWVFPKDDFSYLTDYSFEADVVNIQGVDQPIWLRVSQDRTRYYQVGYRYHDPYWAHDDNNVTLYKVGPGLQEKLAESSGVVELSQNVLHHIKIIVEGNRIKAFFDGVLVVDVIDSSNPYLDGGFGLLNWAGDYGHGNVKNQWDNLTVSSLGATPSFSHRIIILPGMGASWNTRAMVYNDSVGDNEWAMTPFVENYNGLIAALEGKGLVKGTDFWVWNYDWRRPVADISVSLNSFIDSKVSTASGDKVDLVGHSLGGLVARTWAQDHIGDTRMNKAISLGSPHYGAVKAYEAWSGASFSDKLDFSTIALNVLLQLQKQNFQTNFDTIRSKVPALKDIIPTFDFVKKNGVITPVGSLESKNLWLVGKNLTLSTPLFDIFKAVVAVGVPTKEWINLRDRTVFDKVLGVWPDGRLISFEYGQGDGTVLEKSAKFVGDDYDEISANHGDMVDKGISEVLAELGLGVGLDGMETYDLSDTLVFYLGSPAKMEVGCDSQSPVTEIEGFVIIKNQSYSNCQVKLTGVDGGVYHLVIGKTDEENSWRYFEGEIVDGQVKLLNIKPDDGSVVPDTNSEDLVYELIKKDLNLLKGLFVDSLLDDSLVMANNKNVDGLIDKFFAFRLKKRETKISERIVNNLEILLAIKNKSISRTEAENWLVRTKREKGLLDRNTQLYTRRRMMPTVFGSMSYGMLNDKIIGADESFGNSNYAMTAAKATLAIRLNKEVW